MGALCSSEAPRDDKVAGNHNHVGASVQSAEDVQALKSQLQQLQERNLVLARELAAQTAAAKDAARSNAELQSSNEKLRHAHDGLQREVEAHRQQQTDKALLVAQEARTEAEQKLAEVQKQFEQLKSMNNQLRRRVSDLATGHAEPIPEPVQVITGSMQGSSAGGQ